MSRKNNSHQAGFTIVELLIAITIFSVILLLCATVVVQIGRMYQRVNVRSQTQEVARSVIVSLSEAIQFSSGDVSSERTNAIDASSKGFCVDNVRYSYRTGLKLVDDSPAGGETQHALVSDSLSNCLGDPVQNLSGAVTANSRELLSPNMRVVSLSICRPGECSQAPAGSGLYYIQLKLAYGDSDLLDGSGNCLPARFGGAFCATADMSTTVQKRIVRE